MYLDPGMLLVVLSPVEPHAPHHFEPVLHQHLDESKLVKVQQVHQVCLDLRVWLGALQTRQLLSMQLQVNGLHSDNKAKASNGIMLTSTCNFVHMGMCLSTHAQHCPASRPREMHGFLSIRSHHQ